MNLQLFSGVPNTPEEVKDIIKPNPLKSLRKHAFDMGLSKTKVQEDGWEVPCEDWEAITECQHKKEVISTVARLFWAIWSCPPRTE